MIFLPEILQNCILDNLKVSSKQTADCVKKMSDFYITNPQSTTPWNLNWTQIAQLSYYLPLNFIRNFNLFEHVKKSSQISEKLSQTKEISIIDFGCGLGAASLSFFESFAVELKTKKINLNLVDQSSFALKLGSDLISKQNPNLNLSMTLSNKQPNHFEFTNLQVGLFSYSLTELPTFPDWIKKLDLIFILEPSTQQDGRKLMSYRDQLIKEKLTVLFPCTHTELCPLLNESKTDWCHQRVDFKAPTWFLEIERHLPFKNQTLTYSSLVFSKENIVKTNSWARVVGDQLDEKGKSRVLICRNSQREYLSWLHRNKKDITFSRGEALTDALEFEKLGNELRLIK